MITNKELNLKQSKRQNYFDTLNRVSSIVDNTIDNYLNADEFGEFKKIIYDPVLSRKKGTQKLRPTLAYLFYCALSDTNPKEEINEDLAKLIVAPELEIYSEYMVNWIFDNKGTVTKIPLVRKKAAVAAKSFLEDSVKIVSQVDPKYVQTILDTSGNVTKAFTKEFRTLDDKILLGKSFDEFLEYYVNDYGVPGVGKTITVGLDLVSDYLGKKNELNTEKLRKVFDIYGAWLEIMNDLGDFIISDFESVTSDKSSFDQFADIRNKQLTPPIWLMYKHSNKKEKQHLEACAGKESICEKDSAEIVRILFETGSYKILSKKVKSTGRKLKKVLKDEGFDNSGSTQLKQAISMLTSNKIYHKLEDSYEISKEIISKNTFTKESVRKEGK